MERKRFSMVGLLSSAARIPFPLATSICAIEDKSVICILIRPI
ncbi:MAG: hypothetical protein JWM99_2178 [Verrucomicrobiales bacterium]|nr:hypothetical protein [Verrucomicrobiales bacterium]